MIKKGEDILYIEDQPDIRGMMLDYTEENKFANVDAPASAKECERLLEEKKYHTVFIDLLLTDWKDQVVLGGQPRFNGIEIAQYLNKKYPDMLIGLFSTHETELTEKFKAANFTSKVYIASQENLPAKQHAMFLCNGVRNFFEFNIEVRSLPEVAAVYPSEIQIYLAKRLLHIPGPGVFIWKNNQFVWQVLSNKDFDRSGVKPKLEAILPGTPVNYRIKVDPTEFYIDTFETSEVTLKRDKKALTKFINSLDDDKNPVTNKLIGEVVASEFIASLFWEADLTAKEATKILLKLSPAAQLQNQKTLYKNIFHKKGFEGEKKEDIYRHLQPFIDAGLPKVLEVFEGQVDSITGTRANVSLKSKGPEQIVRNQSFDYYLLQQYGIGMHTLFEYTTYKLYADQQGAGHDIEVIQQMK